MSSETPIKFFSWLKFDVLGLNNSLKADDSYVQLTRRPATGTCMLLTDSTSSAEPSRGRRGQESGHLNCPLREKPEERFKEATNGNVCPFPLSV